MSDDILDDMERTYKSMVKLWNDRLKEEWPNIVPMRYQRFKILRSIVRGFSYTPDISDDSGIDRSTTADLLHGLLADKYVTRSAVDHRSYGWEATLRGREICSRLETVLHNLKEQMRYTMIAKMEEWL